MSSQGRRRWYIWNIKELINQCPCYSRRSGGQSDGNALLIHRNSGDGGSNESELCIGCRLVGFGYL